MGYKILWILNGVFSLLEHLFLFGTRRSSAAFSGILVSIEISQERALQESFWNWKLFSFVRYLAQHTKLQARDHCEAKVVSAHGEPWVILFLPLRSHKHTAGGIGSGHRGYHIVLGRGTDWSLCSSPLPFSPKERSVRNSLWRYLHLQGRKLFFFSPFWVKGNW